MKIGLKIAISLVIPLVGLTALFGYLHLQRSRAQLHEELSREGRAIALVTRIAVEGYLRDRQMADIRMLVDRVTGYERVLGLRVFDRGGGIIHQSQILDQYPFLHREELRTALAEGRPAQMRRTIGDRPAVGFIFPLADDDGDVIGAVQVLQLESFVHQDTRASRDFIIGLSLAMAIASVAMVFFMTRVSVTRPIEQLVRSFRDVGRGDLNARVDARGNDELARLAREFNAMCERLEATQASLLSETESRRRIETRLKNAERLAGLGRLAAGLAHEIGTPLNVISGRADNLIRNHSGNPLVEKNLTIISAQIDRIARIVRDMLDFARMKAPRRSPTEIAPVLRSVLDLTDGALETAGIRVAFSAPEDLPAITADADQLQQVFLNLVLNAADAMPGGGDLKITVQPLALANPERGGPPRRHVAVRIQDTGSGIAPEHRDHVFDPFFTTKETGKGTGLGLSVSYGIVEEHGGWFELDSATGRGTSVTVFLPVDGPAVSAPRSAGSEVA